MQRPERGQVDADGREGTPYLLFCGGQNAVPPNPAKSASLESLWLGHMAKGKRGCRWNDGC